MGLIKEPKDVDFYVIDKEWTDSELKEFSELIKQQKSMQQKKKLKNIRTASYLQKTKV